MKRVISLISLVGIVASLLVIGLTLRSSRTEMNLSGVVDRFEVGQQRQVRFRADAEAIDGLSEDELEDQLRDWLLYAVLDGAIADAGELRDSLFDLPPTRAHYVQAVAAFDFGPVRFRVIDRAGSAVALIPQNSANRTDLLAQIADAIRTRLGSAPRVLRVFEYRLDDVELTASVTRKPDIEGAALFTSAYGYVEQDVRNVQQLAEFLQQTNDLVWAAPGSDGLRVGGRQAPGANGRKLRVEDVAALWQSEDVLSKDHGRIDAFRASWRDETRLNAMVEEIWERERAELVERFPALVTQLTSPTRRSRGRSTEVERLLEELRESQIEPLFPDRLSSPADPLNLGSPTPAAQAALRAFNTRWDDPQHKYAKQLLQARHNQEFEALTRSLTVKGAHRIDGSGFSLDPVYDYTRLREVFGRHRAALSRLVDESNLAAAEQGLQNRNERKLLEILYELAQNKANAFFVATVEDDLQQASFQHARYDGTLKGTEVGMVLFYTDLLAKLWALDYQHSAPDRRFTKDWVRGFIPLLKLASSPIYAEENRVRSSTRLWFGPQDNAFSKSNEGLRFARVATRVYAASSSTLQPGKEAEANAESAAFLGWWNDHYSQVAEYEPEYQRLNQIMKWSTVLAWLSGTNQLSSLGFLASDRVSVKRDNWFPTWVTRNPELRFRAWDTLRFKPAGYEGVDTESLDLLVSRLYFNENGSRAFAGGVSLASKQKLTIRPTLHADLEPLVRRASAGDVTVTAEGLTVKSFDETVTHAFRPKAANGPSVVTAKSAAKVRVSESEMKLIPTKLRGRDVEVKPGTFEFAFERSDAGSRVRLDVNKRSIAELSVRQGAGSTIEVVFTPLEIEYSRALSKTLSRAAAANESGVSALAARGDVRTVIEASGTYYVESANQGGRWLRIAPEGTPQVDVNPNVDVRFARLLSEKHERGSRWTATFIEREQVDLDLRAQSRYLTLEPPDSPGAGVAFRVSERGPPTELANLIDLHSLPIERRGVLAAIDAQRSGAGAGRGGRGAANGAGRHFDGPDGRRLVREAIDNPDKAVAYLAETRRRRLDRADTLIREGQFEQARLELDGIARVLPADYEVAARRVVVHAASGSSVAMAEAARLPVTMARLDFFLQTADAVLPQLAADSAGYARLSAIVRGVVARAHGRDAHYVLTQGELGIEIRLAGFGVEAPPSAATAARPRYSLETLDANGLPITASVPPPSMPITGKLRDSAVALTEPDVIVDTSNGTRYRKAGTAAETVQRSFQARFTSRGGDCSNAAAATSAARNECSDDVYLTNPYAADGARR